jgi:5-methylcytosine-specific restriction endonuclease McrA
MKTCKKHGQTKHYTLKDGRIRCAKCSIEAVTKRRRKLKKMSIDYCGGCCWLCGYDKYVGALHFHHANPETKSFGVSFSNSPVGWKKLKPELDKCVLVCSNCHAEIHATWRKIDG